MDFDCQKCGACCRATPPYSRLKYVTIYSDDLARMTVEQRNLHTVFEDGKYGIKIKDNLECSALNGNIGSCVECKIYDNRPDICRNFEAGSMICRLARYEAGFKEDYSD